MDGWLAPIDAYCERTDASFWSEPLNAVSNGAFLIAALAMALLCARHPQRHTADVALATLVAIIAVGSFLFHTFANRWSALADVIPIAVFILLYFALAMRRFFGMGLVGSMVATGLFQAAAIAITAGWARLVRLIGYDPFNGSVGYLPALAAMAGVGWGLMCRDRNIDDRRTGARLLAAGAVFAVSLTFRSLDQTICAVAPAGTHFMWHVLNALVLYLLGRAALLHVLQREHAR